MPRPNRESRVKEAPVKAPAQPTNGTPQRQGAVRMLVSMAHSVGVVAITSETKQGPVSKNYLLRVIGSMKFALTRFKENGEDGQTTYVVNLVSDTPYCGCED